MVLEQPWAQKRMLWVFEQGFFQGAFFSNFWVTKLKPFSWKLRKSVQSYLNQNLAKWSFLENGFRANLSSITNVLSLWKGHFSAFYKFLSDEVETNSWESEAKRSNLFKSKFGYMKLPRKWFWCNLEVKNKCCERLKKPFSSFSQIFEWRIWNSVPGKWGKVFKSI